MTRYYLCMYPPHSKKLRRKLLQLKTEHDIISILKNRYNNINLVAMTTVEIKKFESRHTSSYAFVYPQKL